MDVRTRNTSIWTKLRLLLPIRGYFYYLIGSIFHPGISHPLGHRHSLLAWMKHLSLKTQSAASCAWRWACERDASWSEHGNSTEDWTCVNCGQLSALGNNSQLQPQRTFPRSCCRDGLGRGRWFEAFLTAVASDVPAAGLHSRYRTQEKRPWIGRDFVERVNFLL